MAAAWQRGESGAPGVRILPPPTSGLGPTPTLAKWGSHARPRFCWTWSRVTRLECPHGAPLLGAWGAHSLCSSASLLTLPRVWWPGWRLCLPVWLVAVHNSVIVCGKSCCLRPIAVFFSEPVVRKYRGRYAYVPYCIWLVFHVAFSLEGVWWK